VPIATLGLGVVFAFTGFSGFEVAATLGEESRTPTRVIPAAMVVALLVSGGIYTVMSYVETVAYPSPEALAAAAERGVPLASIASSFVGSGFGTVINIAAVISGFGAQLATVNGATRLVFALSRSGLAPTAWAVTDPVHGTPVRALRLVALATIVPVLALYFRPPLEAFADLATYGADVIIVAYTLTIVAALVWSLRKGRVRPLRAGILLVGVLLIGYVIKTTVWPLPNGAPRLYLYAAAATVLAGLVLTAVYARRGVWRQPVSRLLGVAAAEVVDPPSDPGIP
jgi:amino acid transporter